MPRAICIRYLAQVHTLYRQADDAVKHQGRTWYATEHAYAVRLARKTGYPVNTICACLAILSPRCQWPRVKSACAELLAGRKPAGLFDHNVAKAEEALRAKNGIPIDPKSAPKTWAFWQNLWHPGDPEPVTLDSWMFRAHSLPAGNGIRTYRMLADAYRVAARELGLIPNQLQATIWLYVKGRPYGKP